MEKDKLSRKKFQWNTETMLIIGSLLLFFGGIIYGAITVNNRISILAFTTIIVGVVMAVVGSFLVARSSYIEKLNAIGRPTTSIETGQKYQVLSVVIPDKQNSERERKASLLLQGGGKIIFYQRNINEMPEMPGIGDIIILTKFGELVIIRKE